MREKDRWGSEWKRKRETEKEKEREGGVKNRCAEIVCQITMNVNTLWITHRVPYTDKSRNV